MLRMPPKQALPHGARLVPIDRRMAITSRFPDPLERRSTASRSSISTTPPRPRSRRQVIDAMVQAYEHEYANVHRGLHFLANAATEAYEGAREKRARAS